MYIVKDLDITGGDKMKVKISLIVPPTEKNPLSLTVQREILPSISHAVREM